jgi:hypothetical protein
VLSGKRHIETNAPSLSALKVDFDNVLNQRNNQVTYKGELVLHADTEDGQGVIYYTEDGTDPTNSKYAKTLKPGDSLTIKGNRKVRLTVADEKGNYSAVQTFEIINDLEKYVIKRSLQASAFDEVISFVFPISKETAQISINSFIQTLHDSGLFTDEELRQAIQDALDKLKS